MCVCLYVCLFVCLSIAFSYSLSNIVQVRASVCLSTDVIGQVSRYRGAFIYTGVLLQLCFYRWASTGELLQVCCYRCVSTGVLLQVGFYG